MQSQRQQQLQILPIHKYKHKILYSIEKYGIIIIVGETGRIIIVISIVIYFLLIVQVLSPKFFCNGKNVFIIYIKL